MKIISKSLLACAVLVTSAAPTLCQSPERADLDAWSEVSRDLRPASTATRLSRYFHVDLVRLGDRLETAGWEDDPSGSVEISLPMADGSRKRFAFVRTEVLSADSAREFPDLRSFRGRAIDSRDDATADLVMGKDGLISLVLAQGDAIRLESDPREPGLVRVARSADLYRDSGNERTFSCATPPFSEFSRAANPRVAESPMRREIAVALTSTQSFAIRSSAPEMVMDALLSQASMVYEREVGVRFRQAMLFPHRLDDCLSTDPHLTTKACQASHNPGLPQNPTSSQLRDWQKWLHQQNQTLLDDPQILGGGSYDLGHVLASPISAASGLAGETGNACKPGEKAKGVTVGLASDPLDSGWHGGIADRFFQTFLHELGHQLGAEHSFSYNPSSSTAKCYGTLNLLTAYEPGTGSTLMSYAGRCPAGDIQSFPDLYFHANSLGAIQSYVAAANCGTVLAPIIPPSFENFGTAKITIPRETPFALSKRAVGGAVTYTWEQFDAGHALFRSFSASPEERRTFPKDPWMPALGETLPDDSNNDGTLNFRVTARNGTGGVAFSDVVVSVAKAGPFRIAKPSSQAAWLAGTRRTVRWVFDNAASDSELRCDPATVWLARPGSPPVQLSAQPIADGAELQVPSGIQANDARLIVECGTYREFFARSDPFKIINGAMSLRPTARFSIGTRSSQYPQVNVAFDARTTSDFYHLIQSFDWTLGSSTATFPTSAPFVFVFDQPGRYPVQLDVKNDGEILSSASDTVVIPYGHATVGGVSGGPGQFALSVGSQSELEFCVNQTGSSAKCNFPQNACGRITLWILNLGTGQAQFRLTLGGGAAFSNGSIEQSFLLSGGEAFDFSVDDPCP